MAGDEGVQTEPDVDLEVEEDFEEDTPVIPELPLDEIRRRQRAQGRAIRRLNRSVHGMQVTVAGMNGTLGELVRAVHSQRRISEVHQKVTIETDAKRESLKLEDEADAKKTNRGLVAKLLGLFITGAGLLITVVTQC